MAVIEQLNPSEQRIMLGVFDADPRNDTELHVTQLYLVVVVV